MYNSFFVILSGSLIATYANRLIFGAFEMHVHDITALFVLTILTDLGYFIFYAKKELNRKQMLFRHGIHMVFVLTVVISVALFMGWVLPEEPGAIIVLALSIIAVYILVFATGMYRSKLLADKLTAKLKERYE